MSTKNWAGNSNRQQKINGPEVHYQSGGVESTDAELCFVFFFADNSMCERQSVWDVHERSNTKARMEGVRKGIK